MTGAQLFASLSRTAKLAIARNDSRYKDLVFGYDRDKFDAATINETIALCERYARRKG